MACKNVINVLEYLEKSAQCYPDKPAFVDEELSLSFSELWQSARKIGSMLLPFVKKGSPVVVYMEKGPRQVAAFLGAVYAGCFYVPIDTSMPGTRVRLILDTLHAETMIVDEHSAEAVGELHFEGICFSYAELAGGAVNEAGLAEVRRHSIDGDPLYAIFTSGSTGVPKGVCISQRSVVNLTEWYCTALDFSEKEIFGNQTPFYFDSSVKEIYAVLRSAATMVMIPKALFAFPVKLIEYVNEKKINCVDWVPSVLCMVANFKTFDKVKPLYFKKLIFMGEVMPTKQFNLWRRHLPDVAYFNLYGPTETTVDCIYYKVEREFADDEVIPIGKPCENTDILLLNEQNELAAPGETGEICVRGVSLALGYYNNQEKTDEVFVQNPLQKNYRELIYRTGDLGKINEYGEIVYVERKDFQIKHMGHRIELGEIEAALTVVEGVARVCCLYNKKKEKIIAVYEGTADKMAIITKIKMALPKYMIPNVYIAVEQLPTNLNGKIDRAALAKEYADG
ncbi:MAG: amino acid adenylation domain-containing protein [Clostridiales bacterium]|nr:amino acid adenylation domain-containing protein [Clostridiales bacterium]